MDWMEALVVVVHVVIAVALVGLVLIQQGKGADAGAAFGGGASQTVFGSQGSGSFLTRVTTFLAIVFFVTSFSLAIFAKQRADVGGEAGIPMVEESAPSEAQVPALDEGAGEAGVPAGEGLPELE
ncbi:preprotein translocase subunit SecG [Marinobacter zhejiangensis]|uniref:Protein-export membrane protein SecG n=1 Tax=Marinobacter zhejiangensis TaxID=488535 RepID=A0A1I4KV54_9GAMM|nr:preprotein translocase subunit SecG [Marinobacter zhejiangensis]SFL82419.1 preprotein translocase subunit SecG [Marinobacter zhejiangensis]